jgi:hypothetical protein
MKRDKNGKLDRSSVVHSMVEGGFTGFADEDGNWTFCNFAEGQVPPTDAEIDAEIAKLDVEYDAQEYARNRDAEYPAIKDQLDYIYHNGVDKWKTDMIDPVKDKYPKG